jgi:hypothetical protein
LSDERRGRRPSDAAFRLASLKVGKSCFMAKTRSQVMSLIGTAQGIEPGSAYKTEAREGGLIVTRTA